MSMRRIARLPVRVDRWELLGVLVDRGLAGEGRWSSLLGDVMEFE